MDVAKDDLRISCYNKFDLFLVVDFSQCNLGM